VPDLRELGKPWSAGVAAAPTRVALRRRQGSLAGSGSGQAAGEAGAMARKHGELPAASD
jgi:hypothetical protein